MAAVPDQRTRRTIRLAVCVVLVCAAAVALPLAAYAVEAVAEGAENWIVVVYMGVMALAGAALGALIRGLGSPASPPARRALIWAGMGLLAAILGYAAWSLLLGG